MEPQALLLRRLPHVAQLALPWPGILGRVGPKSPTLADFVSHLLADQLRRPAIHRSVAGREHHEIGFQFVAVVQPDSGLGVLRHLPGRELDLSIGDQFGGAHVDVVAGSASQILHEQPRVVSPEIQLKSRASESVVEALVTNAHLVGLGFLNGG